MTALCFRPQPVDARGRLVPLVIKTNVLSSDSFERVQALLQGTGLSARVELKRC